MRMKIVVGDWLGADLARHDFLGHDGGTEGYALSDAVAVIRAAQQNIGMPSSVTGSYSGDAAEFAKSLAGEPWLILAAAIAIYIVLGVLYESFIHPLTIFSTLPSAGVGALPR